MSVGAGDTVTAAHGANTINTLLKIKDYSDIEAVVAGETITLPDANTMITYVNTLATESLTGSSTSCKSACTGLCVGTCASGCSSTCGGSVSGTTGTGCNGCSG